MNREGFINRLSRNSSIFGKKYARKSYNLKKLIRYQMENNHLDQKQLAEKLGKRESEISKWLSGFHNFTLKSLIKLEEALDCDLIMIPPVEKEPDFEGILQLTTPPVPVESQESEETHFVFERAEFQKS